MKELYHSEQRMKYIFCNIMTCFYSYEFVLSIILSHSSFLIEVLNFVRCMDEIEKYYQFISLVHGKLGVTQ